MSTDQRKTSGRLTSQLTSPSRPTADTEMVRALNQARQTCNQLVEIPDEEWAGLIEYLSVRHFARRERLIEAGTVPTNYFFVLTGLVRFFYTTPDGREFNADFVAENEFAGAISARIAGEPARFSIEALEPTYVIVVPADTQEMLHDRYFGWERLRRVVNEQKIIKKERREAGFLLDDAERRYLDFLADNPHLDGRIPQYHIASYLGITDVSLSRIKRRLEKSRDMDK